MMGRVVTDPHEPVTKKTSGVIVLPADHPLVLRNARRSDREVLARPGGLLPVPHVHRPLPALQPGPRDPAPPGDARPRSTEGIGARPPADHITAAFLCCLCGVCEVYACPLGLSPRKVFDQMRKVLAAGRAEEPPPARRIASPHEFTAQRRVPLPRLIARLGLSDVRGTRRRAWTGARSDGARGAHPAAAAHRRAGPPDGDARDRGCARASSSPRSPRASSAPGCTPPSAASSRGVDRRMRSRSRGASQTMDRGPPHRPLAGLAARPGLHRADQHRPRDPDLRRDGQEGADPRARVGHDLPGQVRRRRRRRGGDGAASPHRRGSRWRGRRWWTG